MLARNTSFHVTGALALLLGHASVVWGMGVALAYWLGFAVLSAPASPDLRLSLVPPLIGVSLAVSSELIGWLGTGLIQRSAVLGLLLNLLAFLAAAWLMVRGALT